MADVLSGSDLVLLEALPEATLVVASDGRIRFLNRAATELLGHDDAELAGEPVARIIVPQAGQRLDVVAWLARWADDPASPQLRYLTLTGRTRNGQQLRLSVRVARLFQPEPLYLVTMRDVTAEQREHQDVRHAYLVMSRILAISDDAIVNLDKDRNITFFNRRAEQLFGHRAEDVLGRPLDMLLPLHHRARHGAHIDAFERGKSPSRLMGERGEIVGLTSAGEEVPLEASITKVFIDGEPTFSAHLRDIRPRKEAERQLIESRERFRTVFDHAMEAIALLDPRGKVLELNESAQQLLGADVVAEGRYFWELPWWHGVGERERAEARRNAEDNVSRAADGEEIRLRAELVDGRSHRRVIDFSLRPVRTEGRTLAIVAEGRDITAIVGRD